MDDAYEIIEVSFSQDGCQGRLMRRGNSWVVKAIPEGYGTREDSITVPGLTFGGALALARQYVGLVAAEVAAYHAHQGARGAVADWVAQFQGEVQ